MSKGPIFQSDIKKGIFTVSMTVNETIPGVSFDNKNKTMTCHLNSGNVKIKIPQPPAKDWKIVALEEEGKGKGKKYIEKPITPQQKKDLKAFFAERFDKAVEKGITFKGKGMASLSDQEDILPRVKDAILETIDQIEVVDASKSTSLDPHIMNQMDVPANTKQETEYNQDPALLDAVGSKGLLTSLGTAGRVVSDTPDITVKNRGAEIV